MSEHQATISDWKEVPLSETGDFINGYAFKPEDWDGAGLPIIRIQNLTDPEKAFNRTSLTINERCRVLPGDMLVSWSATLDAFVWRGEEAWLNQHIFKVVPNRELVTEKFLHYLLKNAIAELIKSEHLHGSTMRHINRKPFLAHKVRIPIQKEKQELVAGKIEELFSDLDAGVAALKRAQANLKRYRAAVLKAAVEGRLTEQWRAERKAKGIATEPASQLLARILTERRKKWEASQLKKYADAGKAAPKGWQSKYFEPSVPDANELPALATGWCYARVDHLGDVQLGRQRSPKDHHGPNMRPYLRVANVFEDRIDTSDVMSMNFTDREFQTFELKPGDILLNEGQSIELVGRSAIYRGEVPGACFTNTIVRFRPYSGLLTEFAQIVFRAYLRNGRFQKIAGITVNLAHLGAGRFAELEFPLPSIVEQVEVVQLVEAALSKIDNAETEIKRSLERAARLRQTILKRAFEGRLV